MSRRAADDPRASPNDEPVRPAHPDLLERAIRIAVEQHKGQTRKGDGQPYITHPIAVALLVGRAGLSDETVAAALLHDVIEDTGMSADQLADALGDDAVVRAVLDVTKDESLSTTEEKNRQYAVRLESAGREALAVAAADKIHNLFAMRLAVREKGRDVLDNFSQSVVGRLDHYAHVRDVIRERWPDCPLLPELDRQLALAAETLPAGDGHS